MTATRPLCAAPLCTRRAGRGQLCEHHRTRLGQALADLRGDLASGDLAPPLIGWRTGGHGGTLASERDPINLRALAAHGQAPAVLAAWATWVRGQRRPTEPCGDRALLARELDWICGTDQARDFWCQLTSLWSSVRGHLPVRRCTCGGPVWAERGGGWCGWCATAWHGRDLLDLPRAEAA